MKLWLQRCAIVLSLAAVSFSQRGGAGAPPAQPDDVRLPNGKMQRDEILRVEHEANIKDAGVLADLAQQLKEDLEKNDRFVLSIGTLKKTEEIEKLAKKIRSRMRHN